MARPDSDFESVGLSGVYKSTPDRPFLRGFPPPVLVRFRLCGFLPSLAVIFVALSPHPKIPFLADKVGGDRNIAFAVREPAFGTGKIVVFGDVALLLRI